MNDRQSLDRSLAAGIAWTGGLKWVGQVLSWATTLILARLLFPEDFGIMGMATVVLGFIQMINQFGLGSVVVQRKEIDKTRIAQLGAFSLALGVLFFLCGLSLAGPIAWFFDEQRVRAVVKVLSLNFILSSAAVIPRAMLTREMQFRVLAFVDIGQALFTSLVTLVLAWMGFGYWALVIGSLSNSLLATLALFTLRPFRPVLPGCWREISADLRFGWNVVASRIAWYSYSHADFAVVGRILGTVALGAYNVAWTLATLPVEKITLLVMRVTPPVFARVQDQPGELARYLRLLTEGISMLTFPAGIGLALVAPDFVPLVLGEKWLAAVGPLQILALYGGFRSITPFFAQILVATDRADLSKWFSFLSAAVLIPGFVVGARWGTTGVAGAWIAVYPLVVVAFHVPTTFRYIQLPLKTYLRSLWPALSSCAVMAGAVMGVQQFTASAQWPWLRLASAIVAGAGAYSGSLLLFHRERMVSGWRLIRRLRGNP